MCVLWANEDEAPSPDFVLKGFDCDDENSLSESVELPIRRIYQQFSSAYFDKRRMADDKPGLIANLDGTERTSGTVQLTNPIYNDNAIGYLSIRGANFDNPDLNVSLVRVGRYDGGGFYLRNDVYLEKLPMFCASRYITYNREWTERARIMKSGDGADRFNTDVASGKLDQWLRKCLLFTCVEMQNHMRTFTGSDGRFYRNELCMDTTNGPTVASEDLKKLVCGPAEQRILDQWKTLMGAVKQADEYNPRLTYGVYQIFAEIDTSYKDDEGNTVWNNVEVHSALQTLKTLVKEYYNTEIVPTLFEYEFLK